MTFLPDIPSSFSTTGKAKSPGNLTRVSFSPRTPPARHQTDFSFLAGVPNTAIFTLNKEDHTLGNLLSSRLHKYPFIKFSAYIVPHPLFQTIDLRVTTDGSITPKDAVTQACRDVVGDLEVLSREFTKEWELQKIIRSQNEQ